MQPGAALGGMHNGASQESQLIRMCTEARDISVGIPVVEVCIYPLRIHLADRALHLYTVLGYERTEGIKGCLMFNQPPLRLLALT